MVIKSNNQCYDIVLGDELVWKTPKYIIRLKNFVFQCKDWAGLGEQGLSINEYGEIMGNKQSEFIKKCTTKKFVQFGYFSEKSYHFISNLTKIHNTFMYLYHLLKKTHTIRIS